MSDLAYFEYALVLPEERYLIEVQSRKPESYFSPFILSEF